MMSMKTSLAEQAVSSDAGVERNNGAGWTLTMQ